MDHQTLALKWLPEMPEEMFEIIKSEFQGREAFFASSAE